MIPFVHPNPIYATFSDESFIAKVINHLHARVQLRDPPLICSYPWPQRSMYTQVVSATGNNSVQKYFQNVYQYFYHCQNVTDKNYH